MSKQYTLADLNAYVAKHNPQTSTTLAELERLIRADRSKALGPLQTLVIKAQTLKSLLWYEEDVEGYEFVDMENDSIDREKGIEYFSFTIVRLEDDVLFGGEGARNRDDMWFGDWGSKKPVKLTEVR